MKPSRLTAVLAATTLATAVAGCGAEDAPTVEEPPVVTQASDDTGATTAPDDTTPTTDAAPTTEDPGEDDTGQEEEPPATDLPTDPTAYSDVFVQAWVDQDEGLVEQMAADPVILEQMTHWGGHGWTRGEPTTGEDGTVTLPYSDEQNMELEVRVSPEQIEAGAPGVVAVSVREAPYPIPSSAEDYAAAFVNAAGTGDEEYLERLGSDTAINSVDVWGDFVWGTSEVSDDLEDGVAVVTFAGEDDVVLRVLVDRELAEAAAPDAVINALMDGGLPEMGIEDYTLAFVLALAEGDPVVMRYYGTEEVVDAVVGQLGTDGGGDWSRTGVEEHGDQVVVTYADVVSGAELVLTVDVETVAAHDYEGIVAVEVRP